MYNFQKKISVNFSYMCFRHTPYCLRCVIFLELTSPVTLRGNKNEENQDLQRTALCIRNYFAWPCGGTTFKRRLRSFYDCSSCLYFKLKNGLFKLRTVGICYTICFIYCVLLCYEAVQNCIPFVLSYLSYLRRRS